MKIPFVDLKAQYNNIKYEIDKAINRVINSTSFINGETVFEFEKKFAQLLNIKHCIGVGNGTDALIISLKTLGIGNGDEVIVPANSFIATSEAVSAVGAKVVFVDNHPKTYNIDVSKIEEKITAKTKAIIPVHLYGQPADLESILQIARTYNLKVIEDAAQAHFAEYQMKNDSWKNVGTLGDMATFSFYPGKNLGAYGDAGAIVTNNNELAQKARMYANHGRIAKYDHEFEGINSRLAEIQAAVLLVKLKYIEKWTKQRRTIASFYTEHLKNNPDIILPFLLENCNPVWHLYVVRTRQRNELQKYLKENGIATLIHYPIALPNLKAYQYLGQRPNDFPVASEYQNEILSLPLYPEITIKSLDYIINKVNTFFNK